MGLKMQPKVKKYIAAILALSLVGGGVCSYGGLETKAQERTLPGIEKLVSEHSTSGESFQILEIVPEKQDASFGYLIGGQEPIADGKKLSEMPAWAERVQKTKYLEANLSSIQDLLGNDSLVTYESYTEDEAKRVQEVKGQFIEGSGSYNYVYMPTTYRPLVSGEVADGQRYDRIFYCVSVTEEASNKQTVAPTFSFIDVDSSTSNYLNIKWYEGEQIEEGFTNRRYNLYQSKSLAAIAGESGDFSPELYAGQSVYTNSSDTTYAYLGYVAWGDEVEALANDYTVSSGDATPYNELSLYIVNPITKEACEWAVYSDSGYSFKLDYATLAGAEFVEFMENSVNGDFYVSKVVTCDGAPYQLQEEYVVNDSGAYVVDKEAGTRVVYETEEGFDATNAYYFVGDTSQDTVDTVLYNGGFYSNEWFKKHVLNLSGFSGYEKDTVSGGDMSTMNVEVKTLTVTELMALVNQDANYGIELQDVDFVYLSGQGNYQNYGEGLEEAALNLLQMTYGVGGYSQRVPVVLDYQFYEENLNAGNDVLAKLALLLLKVDDDSMRKVVESADASVWKTMDIDSLATDILDAREYLAESVYLNDNTDSPLVGSDFLTDFTDAGMVEKGHNVENFSKVLEEIAYENFLYEKELVRDAVLMEEVVNKASIIRYIMNWSAHRVTVKSSLRVLDLEPCYDFEGDGVLDEAGVKAFMDREGYTGAIEITQMASAEFIGKIEDLNAEYDLIYVGARTGMMNTNSAGQPIYNDSSMNGLIYTHTGDVYSYKKNAYNAVVSESTESTWRLRDDSIVDENGQYYDYYRGPGNDMNSTREEEFEQYIEAGYPVIFADAFLVIDGDNVTVNNKSVDCYSYFDELIDFALSKDEKGEYKYWQKNVYAESQLLPSSNESEEEEAERQLRHTRFCKYLNLSKLTVEWVTNLGEEWIPTEYENTDDGMTFLQPQNGEYTLQFIFSLENDSALSQVSTAYECKLYVDNNSDGRFAGSDYAGDDYSQELLEENSEELSGLTIYVRKNNEWQPLIPIKEGDASKYQLHTGNVYKVVRKLPEDFQGAIPWKLVFFDENDRLVRTAKSGYTAVNRQNMKETIRILQLMSDRNLTSPKKRWDLTEDDELQELLEDVPGFDIIIKDKADETSDVVSGQVSDFINNLDLETATGDTAERYEAYYNAAKKAFNEFDMIILGFGDNYTFGDPDMDMANMAVGEALRDYIESGRSVLFTHDSSSYINTNKVDNDDYSWYWGYEFNKTMRAAVGLDRYGALQFYYEDMRDSYEEGSIMWKRYSKYLNTLQQDYNYDSVYRPISGQTASADAEEDRLPQVEGITKFTLVRYMYNQLDSSRFKNAYDMDYLFPINNAIFYEALNRQNGSTNVRSYVDGQYSWSGQSSSKSGPMLMATQVNEGQITTYPYEIEQNLQVESTHYQWLQPNMELDKDKDGKSDIVVWYTLSDISKEGSPNQKINIYNVNPKDVVNNYYIYNMGNVTYSGAGHTEPESIEEKKLFVNTMVAAYAAGVKAPRITVKNEINDNTDTFYMLYDPINKLVLNGKDDISVRFQVVDYNVLSGEPQIRIDIYKACNHDNEDEGIYVDGITGKVLPIDASRITLSMVADGTGEAIARTAVPIVEVNDDNSFDDYFHEVYYLVQNNMIYEVELSTEELGLFQTSGESVILDDDAAADIFYIRATTVYENGTERTESGVQQFQVSAAELFELK